MNKKLNKVIGDGNIVIPLYILKDFKKLNLTMEEFIFLMYLYNKSDKVDFNPDKIANDLNIDIMEVMGYVSILTDKGYLSLDIIKDNNILEEVINLSNFYDKISVLLMNNQDEVQDSKSLYKYIEKELSRPINSIEIEMIDGWIQNKIDDSLIKEAIKIAIKDGVYNLKYIDKILFDWKSRGITSVQEINNSFKEEKNDFINNVDLDEWNWLDDEEEYITN